MESFGFLCVCISRDYGTASVMANSIMTFWNLSCGFLINPGIYFNFCFLFYLVLILKFLASFPFYLKWISYTSPFLYGFAGLADNQFKDLPYDCPIDDPTSPICAQYSGLFSYCFLDFVY